jgi:hypothetical protein
LNDRTEERLRKLIEPISYANDAYYHASVSMFRAWLQGAEMAMEDEDVDPGTIQRILDRLVYGTPTPFDPSDTVRMKRKDLEEILRNSVTPKINFPVTRDGDTQHGVWRPPFTTFGKRTIARENP